jgi:hypothetical protein
MRRLLLFLAALTAAAGLSRAAAFKAAAVPASALWVVHLDTAGLKQSDAGRLLLARREWKESPLMAGFANRFGLDPVRDMRGLTLYTVSTGRLDAVAVIDPDPAAAVRLKAWREKTGWKAQALEGTTVYSRAAGQDKLFQAAASDGRIITAMTLDHVKRGLGVLEGRISPLQTEALPALADRNGGAGALILVAARTPGPDLIRLLPQLSLLKNADSLCLGFGEKDGLVKGVLTVTAPEGVEADRLRNALDGLVQLGRALGYSNGYDPLQAVSVSAEGGFVRADGRWKTAELSDWLGALEASRGVQR